MRLLLIFLSFVAFALSSPAVEPEAPPAAINAHYSWCGQAKTAEAKLKRYEGFWSQRLPAKSDDYDDHPHVTYVRRCAYRLAALYAQVGQSKKSLAMLKWLESNDEMLPENAKEPR
jgi:hypothetical protein